MRRCFWAVLLLPNILLSLNAPRVLGLRRFEVVFLAMYTALSIVLLVPRSRKVLLGIGRKLGLPHLDMNVEYQPEGALLRPLWILASAVTLTIQIPVAVLAIPFRLVLAIIISFFRTSDAPRELPSTATFLLLLIPKKDRDNLVGDLEEEFFTRMLPRYGPKSARRWYWEQVIVSLGPILWTQVKHVAGLVLLWKTIKK